MNDLLFEKRRFVRAKFQNKERVVIEDSSGREISCVGQDITVKGVGVVTLQKETLAEGNEVEIKIPSIQVEGITGKIKCLSNGDSKEYRMGIEFIDSGDKQRDKIAKSIVSDTMNDTQRIAFQDRNHEIKEFAGNAFRVTVGVLTVSITLVGFSLTNPSRYLYLLPLIVIDLGFRMYQTHLKRIRRMGSYVKIFLEPGLRGVGWERRLFLFRRITHSLKTKPRDRFYTLGYWWIALYLGILALAVGFAKLFMKYDSAIAIPVSYQKGMAEFLYAVMVILFIFRMFCMRKQSKAYEGGGAFEIEMDRIWKRVKQHNDGFCKDMEHFKNLLNVLGQKEAPQDIDKVYCKENAKECTHFGNCGLNSTIKELKNIIEKDKGSTFFKRNKGHTFLVFSFALLFILNVMSIKFSNDYKSFFLSTGVSLIIFGLLICKNVKVKKLYFKHKQTNKILLMSSVATGTVEKNIPFPSNYVKPKIKSLFAWYLWYGWKKEWGKGRKQNGFSSDMWFPQNNSEKAALDSLLVAFIIILSVCLLTVLGPKILNLGG